MTTIIGLSGSLRRGSFNRMLLQAAVEAAPPGTSIEVESIREIPLYDGDLEAREGSPPSVGRLKQRIAGAHGLLIATPEYNSSMPGVLKNAIDWLSRPASDIGRVFGGRPVALMGATPGRSGTALSQAAWLPVLRSLGMRPWFEGSVLISQASTVFDGNGRVIDAGVQDRIRTFVEGFAAFVEAQRPSRLLAAPDVTAGHPSSQDQPRPQYQNA
ncbi:MAG TPA: NADPH-dependent FMN reductase [Vicinamibacteria bacterium]|nr:NADPH-dependent FMN reductase [Vicinamibacteria bacterium]